MDKNNQRPTLRFAGFNGPWEQRKLKECASFSRGNGLNWKDISKDGKRECVLYGHLYTDYGMIADDVTYKTNVIPNSPVYSQFGDVLIPASDTTPTGLARATSLEKSNVLLGGDINIIRPNSDYYGSCLSLALNANRKELIRLIKGTTVRHIHNSEIKEIELLLPPLKSEQVKIAEFFKSLDNLITLHQRKYEKLINIKKSMLEKMFPRDGAKVPEIRFAGFNGPWEQRKLGELSEIKDSARISNELWSEEGIPYIRASDLSNNDLSGVLFLSNDTYEMYKKQTGAPSKGDVLFNGGGEIGKAVLKRDNAPIYVQGGAVLYARTSVSHELDGAYLTTFFETKSASKYFEIASAGGTMKHFTLKPALEMPILYPAREEQEQIGVCFSRLDNLITLHQRKYEKLMNVKKSMLERMFI